MTTHEPRKIPTIVGILLVAGLVAIVGYAFNFFFETRTNTNATKSVEPRQVETTNITDTSCTVTWITDDPATGVVVLDNAGLASKSLFDDRDTTGKLQQYHSHSVTLRGLAPATTYSFSLLSQGATFSNQGQPYTCVTAPQASVASNGLEPSYGTLVASDGTPLPDALVYLTVTGSQVLSTVTKNNGAWLIPLNLVRTEDLSAGLSSQPRMDEQIIVRKGTDEASAVTDTLNDSPVPEMILGKSYDFRKQQADQNGKKIASLPVEPPAAVTSPSVLGENTARTSKRYSVTLTQPKENAALVSNLPLFEGTGVPGNNVSITIGIKSPQTHSVRVATDGVWRFTPPATLAAGQQSVTVTSTDSSGKKTAITRLFEILKSGTQVLGEATASATLTPTPGPTSAPTVMPTDTPVPTDVPLYTPTPESSIAATPTPPVTGSALPTAVIIALSLGFILSGLLLSAF